jgi:hypothetical protein
MIDDPRKTDLLISMLMESLPIQANITPYLFDALMSKSPNITIPKKCNVVSIFYTGDMGVFSAPSTSAASRPKRHKWFP